MLKTIQVFHTTVTAPEGDGRSGVDPVPLCVDLDGSLVRTDVLAEGIVGILFSRQVLTRLPRIVTMDRANLKRRVAELADFNPSLLPYNIELLAYLRRAKLAGRSLVLVTAADALLAHRVADHLGVFDAVISSDGRNNLKGEAKAAALVERYGTGGFDYAGNDSADVPVWQEARRAIVVSASAAVRRRLTSGIVIAAEVGAHAPVFPAALKALRPHQWLKNTLVFIPMLMSHAVGSLMTWLAAIGMFAAFCAVASSIYLINDLTDLSADRQHPTKSRRPLASGQISILTGLLLAAGLGIGGFVFSAEIGTALIVTVYAAASIVYSLALKEYPIVDVFVLAALYTIRMIGGAVATAHPVSLWLLAFSGFLFLALALVKRVGEINAVVRSAGTRNVVRRGYSAGDIPILQAFGCAASFASAIVLSLFVASNASLANYGSPEILWGIVPLALFWQCRLWLSTTRGYMHDDPIVYAIRDWVSWLVVGCVIILVVAATLVVPLGIIG